MDSELIGWLDSFDIAPDIPAREKELYDKFVDEYLFDFSYTNAAIRVGFPEEVSIEYGQKLKHNQYVQKRIAEKTIKNVENRDSLEQLDNKIMHGLIKEANYNGEKQSHSARVMALSKLAAIRGMEAPTKTESKVTHAGQVSIKHEFDFSSLTDDERQMVRKLIEGQLDKDGNTAQ